MQLIIKSPPPITLTNKKQVLEGLLTSWPIRGEHRELNPLSSLSVNNYGLYQGPSTNNTKEWVWMYMLVKQAE